MMTCQRAARWFTAAAMGLGLAIAMHGARAQAPASADADAVRLLVGFAAGGGTDVAARLVAEPLARRLGVPIVVENKPGGGGVVAMEELKRSRPDGRTLLMSSTGTLVPGPLKTYSAWKLALVAPVIEGVTRRAGVMLSTVDAPRLPKSAVAKAVALCGPKTSRVQVCASTSGPALAV